MFWVKLKFSTYTVLLFFLLPYIWILKLTKGRKEFHDYIYTYAISWGMRILKWMKTDVEVIGMENVPDEPVVIISNHQAGYDIPLLFAYMTNKPSFIAKVELSKIPLFASWMRMIGCLFIDRSSARKALESFRKAAELINQGQTVILFPEGTRKPEIIPFKKGSFKLPVMAKVKILPVTIVGTEKVTENYTTGKRSKVTLIVDKPFDILALDKEKQKTIHTDVQDLITNNFRKYSADQ